MDACRSPRGVATGAQIVRSGEHEGKGGRGRVGGRNIVVRGEREQIRLRDSSQSGGKGIRPSARSWWRNFN